MPRGLPSWRAGTPWLARQGRIFTNPACRGALWGASLSYRKGSSPCWRGCIFGLHFRETTDGMSDNEDNVNRELFRNIEKLRQLRIEHRDLDQVISRLTLDIHTDEVQMRRLKKRKLLLKDQITKLESQAIPDLNA
jgi:hypothetical protein